MLYFAAHRHTQRNDINIIMTTHLLCCRVSCEPLSCFCSPYAHLIRCAMMCTAHTHIYINAITSINICNRTWDKRESKCDFAKNKFVWTLAPNPLHWVQRVVPRRIMENCLEYCVINVHVRRTTNATRTQSKCRRHRAFKRGGGIYIHTHIYDSRWASYRTYRIFFSFFDTKDIKCAYKNNSKHPHRSSDIKRL